MRETRKTYGRLVLATTALCTVVLFAACSPFQNMEGASSASKPIESPLDECQPDKDGSMIMADARCTVIAQKADGLCVTGKCVLTTVDPSKGHNFCVAVAKTCDDQNPCTDNTCDSTNGQCVFTNNTAACDDGNLCTEGDVCKDGTCGAGTPKACDDQNPCTDNTCDSTNGQCVFTNNTAACDDGNLCTEGDVCKDGTCGAGTPKACDDQNPCTDNTCDSTTGCVFVAKADCCVYDDDCVGKATTTGWSQTCASDADCIGLPLQATFCFLKPNWTVGECVPVGWVFGCSTDKPGYEGTAGVCTTCADTDANGNCSTYEQYCDNQFDDVGNGKVDCESADCEGQACMGGGTCANGVCVPAIIEPECVTAEDCIQSDKCFSYACTNGACEENPVVCDDHNVCTDDSCDSNTGCVFTNNVATCDGGTCQEGTCVPTPTDECGGCPTGKTCQAGVCVIAATQAVWCWDMTRPTEVYPTCHMRSNAQYTYWAPEVWQWSTFQSIPPQCGSAADAPVYLATPVCCVGPLVLTKGWQCYGGTFDPYQ